MKPKASCPMTKVQITDSYFLEHRAKLLDIAAFLDRLDRAQDADVSGEDFRVGALRRAIAILDDDQGDRARRVLELFSDHTTAMPQSALGSKGATGAAPEVSP